MTPEELFNENITLAKRVTRKYKFPNEQWDDIYSDSLLGLWQAAKRWDDARGVPFEPYARKRMWGQILDGRIQRDPRPCGYESTFAPNFSLDFQFSDGYTLADSLEIQDEADEIESLLDTLVHDEQIAKIRRAMKILTPKQREVVEGVLANRLLRSIGQDRGVSEAAASCLLTRATDIIRRKVAA